MVKAKVALLTDNKNQIEECNSYLKLAKKFTDTYKPIIIIMHGVSGSGKSHVGKELAMRLGAIRIRADLERKRIFDNHHSKQLRHHKYKHLQKNLQLQLAPSFDDVDQESLEDLYSENMTELTYKRLAELTETIINAKFDVIVDATFLKKNFRELFIKLKSTLNTEIVIIETTAPKKVLIDRIITRKDSITNVSDANIEILEKQLINLDKLSEFEQNLTISVNTTNPLDISSLTKQILVRKN